MKRKLLFVFTLLVLSLLLLASCGGCGDNHNWEYRDSGVGDHIATCTECGTMNGNEPHETIDGKCGVCLKCGTESVCDYVGFDSSKNTAEGHAMRCSRCSDEVFVDHTMTAYDKTVSLTYHKIVYSCTVCGTALTSCEDHVTASGEWKTDATTHSMICDVCEGEHSFGIHNLKDGACTECSYAADSLPVTTSGLEFTLSDNEKYYILTKINANYGDNAVIVIPDTYEDKPVLAIGPGEYTNVNSCVVSDDDAIKAIYVPDSVVTIESAAFYSQGSLIYARLSGKLTKLGEHAFNSCNLTSVNIPGSLAEVGAATFDNNKELRTVTFGEGVGSINNAFLNCTMLTKVSLPSTLHTVVSPFSGCDFITDMTLLRWDEKLEKYVTGNSWFTVVDGALIEKSGMKLIRAGANMTIPNGVKVIDYGAISGDGVFYYGFEPKTYTLSIPTSVVEINGFFNNSAIKGITVSAGNKVYGAEGNCLYTKSDLCIIWGNETSVIPKSVVAIGAGAFSECDFDKLVIPSNIKTVYENAFDICTANEIIIENGVENLSLYGNNPIVISAQHTITIPASVKYLDMHITGIDRIVISEGVEEINRLNLGENVAVELPASVTKIGNSNQNFPLGFNVYEGVKYLGNESNPYLAAVGVVDKQDGGMLAIHKDTRVIADGAFSGTSYTDVTLNNKLEYIGASAFSSAKLSGIVTLPESVKEIGDRAFSNIMTGFTLVLNDGAEKIGEQVVDIQFYGTSNTNKYGKYYYLASATNPYFAVVGVDYVWEADEEYIYHKDTKAITCVPTIPTKYDGTGAEWAKIYKTDAFYNYFANDGVEPKIECSDGIVDPYGATWGLEFVNSQNYLGTYAVSRGTATGNITIPAIYKGVPVTEIASYGFGSASITSVSLPDSIRIIEVGAFMNSAITEITIPNSTVTIREDAFSGCASLKTVSIGDGVKRIEANAFAYCTAVEAFTLPDGIEYFNKYAVAGCPDAVYSVKDENGFYIGSKSNPYFALAASLSTDVAVINPATIMILNDAFKNSTVTSVVVPDSVKFIGDNAFASCKQLAEVTIGKGITEIPDFAFQSCTALTKVVFLGAVTVIGDGAFQYCENLSDFAFPEGLEIIGDMAFQKCNKLVFSFGKSLIDIGARAFEYCFYDRTDGITEFTYAGTVEEWEMISVLEGWFYSSGATKVVCTNGEISLIEE